MDGNISAVRLNKTPLTLKQEYGAVVFIADLINVFHNFFDYHFFKEMVTTKNFVRI